MFFECTSLTQAPELPATQLADGCYFGMFGRCTNLTQAPQLPATKLANICYRNMFSECTNLTQAPQLPAKELAAECYTEMFKGCTNLVEINVGFTEWREEYELDGETSSCTRDWLSGVAPTGTFICPKELPKEFGASGIPPRWKIIEN